MTHKCQVRAAAATGVRFSLSKNDKEVARAYLYILSNDLHKRSFGLMEDVWVAESERGNGYGTAIVREVVEAAKKADCYKLLATSRNARPKVHALYERLGFERHGLEFRITF